MPLSKLMRDAAGLFRALSPIDLGQTKPGLLAAAVLLGLWQLGATASARQTNPGHSENNYFRVDWDYDLAGGTGLIRITENLPFDPNTAVFLFDQFDFTTFGQKFDRIGVVENFSRFREDPIGDDFRYSPDPYLHFINGLTVFVEFPSEGLKLVETGLDYEGHGYYSQSTTFFPFVIPPSAMNFVSIRAIVPEPASALSLLLGAIVTGAVSRRRS
jgi:hypothetical protein